ncbi:MAG: PilZ domain-containing protein [Desulfarculaceae bacterium]
MDNRRQRTRVNFHTVAQVQAQGVNADGLQTEDLSLKGVFLVGDLALSSGQHCDVSIRLMAEGSDTPTLRMQGKVIRSTPEGTAIEFTSLDPETYVHLRNLVLLNADDPDSAEEELIKPAFDPAAR